jgi:hypothetical protein
MKVTQHIEAANGEIFSLLKLFHKKKGKVFR